MYVITYRDCLSHTHSQRVYAANLELIARIIELRFVIESIEFEIA